jgi:hypothetical protein
MEVVTMKLRYFVLDPHCQLRRVSRSSIRKLWDGDCRADALGCSLGSELGVVSVVCDTDLLPQRVYLLRLPLERGLFGLVSYFTLYAFTRRYCVTSEELVRHHAGGWPRDFFRQLAVALDVPLAGLNVPLGIGGPLLVAAARRVTPEKALRHLR